MARELDHGRESQDVKRNLLSSCRLIYGSERFKFYDIAICENDATKQFGAILTYSQDGSIKLLRTAESNDSIDAVRALVDRLQKDTATLFTKYSAGSQIRGQQGFANKENGKFELSHAPSPRDNRIEGPDDDTAGLTSG